MAQTTRQSNLLVNQDWTKVYQSFTNADFTSYDFETLRNSMISYLQTYYPETFNDFIESSEYLALIDMIAFLGQSLSFRTDLNARENFLDTAQRRDSILKLARMLSYNPTRTQSASGLLKFDSISTTENIVDSNGVNLSGTTIYWNDVANINWLEQFTTILNSSLAVTQAIGKPGNSQTINGVQTDEYAIQINTNTLPIAPFNVIINNVQTAFEAVSATSIGKTYIYEKDPTDIGQFNILYRNDNNGNGSNNTGFFMYFKQGSLQATNVTIQNAIPNNYVSVKTNNINNTDGWLYSLDVNGNPQTRWSAVPALSGINVVYNQLTNKNLYQVNTQSNDQVNLVFGDGSFANIPQGPFRYFFRTSNGLSYTITPDDMSKVTVSIGYISAANTVETLTITASLKYTVTNATASQSTASIKTYAPQQYYTQNRMITSEDYNIFPLTNYTSIQKAKAVNRISSGVSLYLDTLDPTGTFSSTNIFGSDGVLSEQTSINSSTFGFLTTNDVYNAIYNQVIPIIGNTGMVNYYYANYPRLDSPYSFGQVTFKLKGSSTSRCWGTLQYSGSDLVVGTSAAVGNLQYVTTGALLCFADPVTLTNYYYPVTNVVGNVVYFGGVITNGMSLGVATKSPAGESSAKSIIPAFKNSLTNTTISAIAGYIESKVNFGMYFDQTNQVWSTISPSSIGTSTNWLLKFSYQAGVYNIQYQNTVYQFGSASQTKFYFDPTVKVYDSTFGTTVTDTIKVLSINPSPISSAPIGTDISWNIYDVIVESDGYVDSGNVLVTFPQTMMPGVPDNPDLYKMIAGNSATSRGGIYFQYRHNAPGNNRIDPTPVNLVDLYILTADYATSYMNWLQDITGTLTEPTPPTSSSLEIAYSSLDSYKTTSDTIVYSPAIFKPLFGAKAPTNLQARFQVVKNPAVSITDNEVKSQLIAAVNTYFDVNNWDFGETFYFSELAAYLHSTLVPNIASVLIIPKDTSLIFGNYFQINAEPWQIITNAATVDDVDIISAVTAATLNLNPNYIL
jgi:hypothetical protein